MDGCRTRAIDNRVAYHNNVCKLSVTQIVKFLVVEPDHHGSSPRLGSGAHIFLDIFQTFQRCSFSGRRRFPRLQTGMWWLRQSKDIVLAQYLKDADRGRVCVCAFIRVSICVYIGIYVILCSKNIMIIINVILLCGIHCNKWDYLKILTYDTIHVVSYAVFWWPDEISWFWMVTENFVALPPGK